MAKFDELNWGLIRHKDRNWKESEMKIRTYVKSGAACYTVQIGDSLSKIAQQFYGNGSEYPKIYYSNLQTIGSDPGLIYPGQKLYIPD